jgi:ribulose-5-phosphate 4-epimerase/fuculose-1-phosphate aldolase
VSETGSIKFTCDRVAVELSRFAGFDELNEYRRKLLRLGTIGIDANGVGFGNLSVRNGATSHFYITGSGTGKLLELTPADCARVVAYDITRNWLQCEGLTVASSESLTHAAVYESDPTTCAVIHCHDMKLWMALLHKVPTTPEKVEYGTPELAYAVRGLFDNTDVVKKKIFVMAGHEGGVVAFGRDLRSAFAQLIKNKKLDEAEGELKRKKYVEGELKTKN